MKKVGQLFKNGWADFKMLLRNVPSYVIAIFVLSVVCANLMANKELVSYRYVALDCGFVFSWIMFLCMDVICKRWGPKASIKISVMAIVFNLVVTLSFFLLSKAPGMWGEFYTTENPDVNEALNKTFGGSWYVVLGSALASLVSSVVNALLNWGVGRTFRKDNFFSFAARTYVSTIIAQFVDNLIFATVVSKIFFGWTWTQVFICSAIGAVCELLCEVLFSGLGYRIVKKWEEENVGQEYLDHLRQSQEAKVVS